jgi:hypothetical protein
MWGPGAFDRVVKRIIHCVSTEYGPMSEEELVGASRKSQCLILPFDLGQDNANVGFKGKRASLVKKIVASFLRECLEIEIRRVD